MRYDEWKPRPCCQTDPEVTDVYGDGGIEAKVTCPRCKRVVTVFSDEEDRSSDDVILEAIARWNAETEEAEEVEEAASPMTAEDILQRMRDGVVVPHSKDEELLRYYADRLSAVLDGTPSKTGDADRMAKIRNTLKWAQDYLSRLICEPTCASLPEASDLADDIWDLLKTWEAT